MTFTDTNYTDNMIRSPIESLLQEYGLSRTHYDELCDYRGISTIDREDAEMMEYSITIWDSLDII